MCERQRKQRADVYSFAGSARAPCQVYAAPAWHHARLAAGSNASEECRATCQLVQVFEHRAPGDKGLRIENQREGTTCLLRITNPLKVIIGFGQQRLAQFS